MDTYSSVLDFLSNISIIREWPDVQRIVAQTAAKKPHAWQLPVVACEAVGGTAAQAIPAAAAVACQQISIILVDDLLDDDPRGEYLRTGAPAAANLAVAFQATALECILRDDFTGNPTTKLRAARNLNDMVLTVALGQHLDIGNPADEGAYWRVVETKSGPFFGAALHVGALAGDASIQVAEQIEKFGWLYGEMIQIHDDLHDTLAVPANPDWVLGRSPLPILFAQVVEHADRARFLELRRSIAAPEALAEAQAILIRSGAVSYCVDQLIRRHQAAQSELAAIPLIRREKLEKLLDELIEPVWGVFTAVGVGRPESIGAAMLAAVEQ